jgi:hypothetical protein
MTPGHTQLAHQQRWVGAMCGRAQTLNTAQTASCSSISRCVSPPAADDIMDTGPILVDAILYGFLGDGGQGAQVGEGRPQPAHACGRTATSRCQPVVASSPNCEFAPCDMSLHIAACP